MNEPRTRTGRDLTTWLEPKGLSERPEGAERIDGMPYKDVALAIEREAIALGPETRPHPGIEHQFVTTCRLCGELGFLHISLVTQQERVTITNPEERLGSDE